MQGKNLNRMKKLPLNKKNSLSINAVFSIALQFSAMLFPIIVTPYISKVLDIGDIGKINFSTSVVNLFLILTIFGTVTYGAKEVAKRKSNEHELNNFISEMLVIKLITSISSILIYLALIMAIPKFRADIVLYLIQGLYLFFGLFSFDWYFHGTEDFKFIAIRSMIVKVVSFASIFLFVKTKSDFIIYALITVLALSASNLWSFFKLIRTCHISFKALNLKRHIRPLLIFFGSAAVFSVYSIVDSIILGFVTDETEVAIFSRSKMFVLLAVSLALAISDVFMARTNSSFLKDDKSEYKTLLRTSADVIIVFTTAAAAGLYAIANDAMLLFGNEEFMPGVLALKLICPLIIFTSLSAWQNQHRIIPLGHESFALKVQIGCSIFSVLGNLVIIHFWGFIGAAIIYLLVESVGFLIKAIYLKRKDKFNYITLQTVKVLIGAAFMVIALYYLNRFLPVSWLYLSLKVLAGIGLYLIVLLLLRERTTINIVINLINKIFKKKKIALPLKAKGEAQIFGAEINKEEGRTNERNNSGGGIGNEAVSPDKGDE